MLLLQLVPQQMAVPQLPLILRMSPLHKWYCSAALVDVAHCEPCAVVY
jgi:hypothetical protein